MSRAFFDVTSHGTGNLFSLPVVGVVTAGSAPHCDIRVDGVEAVHLRFDTASHLMEVIGPGVRFGDEEIAPGGRWPVEPGEVVTVGETRLVYITWRQVSTRVVSSHEYFEQRAAEECIRAGRRKSFFSVVNVRLRSTLPSGEIESAIASSIRLTDVLSLYVPGIYELLLFDTDADGAAMVVSRIQRVLEQLEVRAVAGAAHFPHDGRSVDELTEAAALAAVGGSGHDPCEDPTFDVTVMGSDDLIGRVSKSELNVLLLGETGSGKEVLAARVHRLSRRASEPFLKLNCAAFTETLLESELFGHEKGSFTGAHALKQGLLETADGGTVFLDEIGELPLTMQSKLLRVLEERMVLRVGGLKARAINVRFVAATNRDLELEVEKGRFRADLYFRLDGATLVVPPLRERMTEFEAIASELLKDASAKTGRAQPPRLSENALNVLKKYHWPGNIRELRNVLERAVMLTEGNEIHRQHLPLEKLNGRFASMRVLHAPTRVFDLTVDEAQRAESDRRGGTITSPSISPVPPSAQTPDTPPAQPVQTFSDEFTSTPGSSFSEPSRRRRGLGLLASSQDRAVLEAHERKTIEDTLTACAGNQSRAAELLGISRRTLIKRIAAYGIARPRKRS